MLAPLRTALPGGMRRALAQTVMLSLLSGDGYGAVILQYHNVADDTPASTSVTPEQFAMHLDRLEREGFRVLPLDELVAAVRGGLDPREKVVAITFDDGARNLYDNALPLLDRRGWKAAVFVATELIGQRGMLTPEQLRDMHRRGHLVLNHSHSHPHMVRNRPGENDTRRARRLRAEIEQARARLADWLGEPPPPYFAWPYGEFDAVAVRVLHALDHIGFAQGSGALDAAGPWHAVPRIPVNRQYADWPSLRDKLLALPLPVRRTQPEYGVTREARPVLDLWLEGDWTRRPLDCFAGGERVLPGRRLEGGLTRLTLQAPVPVGRGRFTCTAAAGEGRFWWYSWMWMRRAGDDWYPEY